MLQITIPATELWVEQSQEFIHVKEQTLQLEHSLVSLSKWESKWHKAFFSKREKTVEETIDYIRCMTITPNVDPNVYAGLTSENVKQIDEYIGNPMSATKFFDDGSKRSNEVITSELIYYWMIAQNVPFECQKWHINRLMTLIRVCSLKNSPKKKMSKAEIMRRNSALNASRKAQLHTKG